MTRHEMREQTFRLLFGMGFHEAEDREALIENYLDETMEHTVSEAEREELIGRTLAIYDRVPELDRMINGVAEGWTTNRMGKAELNILRLALYEMQYDEGVPLKVAINEAVELCKLYGEEDAPAFVNGILAKFVKENADALQES